MLVSRVQAYWLAQVGDSSVLAAVSVYLESDKRRQDLRELKVMHCC